MRKLLNKRKGCKRKQVKFDDECIDITNSREALDIKLTKENGIPMMTLIPKNTYGNYLVARLEGHEKGFVKFLDKELKKIVKKKKRM